MSFVLNSKLQALSYITNVFNCLFFANSIFPYGYNKFRMNCRQSAVSVSVRFIPTVDSTLHGQRVMLLLHALQQDHTVVLAICSNQ